MSSTRKRRTSPTKEKSSHNVRDSPSGFSKTCMGFAICGIFLFTALGFGIFHNFKWEAHSGIVGTSTPSSSKTDNSWKTKDTGNRDTVATQHTMNSDEDNKKPETVSKMKAGDGTGVNSVDNRNDVQWNEKPETISKMKRGDGTGDNSVDNNNNDQWNEKPETISKMKTGDGTGGLIPDDEDLLWYLSDVTKIQLFCSSLGLGVECSVITKQHHDLDHQKSEMLLRWKQLQTRTWKDFIRSLSMLQKCIVAKNLADEHSVEFNPSDKEDKKALNKCKTLAE